MCDPIYVTGHRNPDTDSIASAIGYAELKGRLDPDNDYVAVRLGRLQHADALAAGANRAHEPRFLPHVMPRAARRDADELPGHRQDEPLREAGLAMGKADLELVPIVDDDGALTGVLTERALARRYVRELARTSTLEEAPTS